MKIAPLYPICLYSILCSCHQHSNEPVHIHRLAPTVTLTKHKDLPLPDKDEHFCIFKNEQLLKTPGEKHLEINLATQRGTFFINGLPAMEFPVCTGRKGYETPTGTFSIKEKRRHHHSNIYDVAMPCFMRLTYDGIGLHVGEIRKAPASHGCIRLPKEACLPIFHATKPGTRVVIF